MRARSRIFVDAVCRVGLHANEHVGKVRVTAPIAEYIEEFYNPVRRHSYLGYSSPIEFELKTKVAALAA